MIENTLIRNCLKNQNKIAIICGDTKISYLNLINNISLYSLFLKKKIKKKNRILLKSKNSIEWVIYYFAIKFANNIPVIISHLTSLKKTKKIILENKIKYIIADEKLNFKNITNLKLIKLNFKNKKIKTKKFLNFNNQYDEILYTSGTTDAPKGVVLTKQNSYFIAKMINKIVRLKKKTIELISIPLSHSFGIGRLKCFAVNGHTLIINDDPSNFGNFFVLLEKYKVNGFSMVPSGINILKKIGFLNFSKIAKHLDFIELGSERLNKLSLEWLRKVFKKTTIYYHYGMTEASRSAFKIYRNQNKKLSYYKSSPGIKINLVNNNNKFCKKNETGEIIIKGKSVSCGYVNKKIMGNKFSKFGYRSGDLAKKISKNKFELKGRIDKTKKINGVAVNLDEVENYINDFPDINNNVCKFIYDNSSKAFKIYSTYYSKKKVQHDKLVKFLSTKIERFKIPYKFKRIKSLSSILSKKKINFATIQA